MENGFKSDFTSDDFASDFGDAFDNVAPVTLAEMSERSPELQRFINAREKSRAKFGDVQTVENYVCLVFQSHEQREQFMAALPAVETLFGMFVDGQEFAAAVGVKVTPNVFPPLLSRLDRTLSGMTL